MNHIPNQKLSAEELTDVIYDLELDCIDLEKQLELYSDRPKDPAWPAKARAALKIKRLQVTDLQRRRDLLKGFSEIDSAFVAAARTLLAPDLYQRVMDDAKERMLA